jgi:hypothetical protein
VTRLRVAVLVATIVVLSAAAPGWAGTSKFDVTIAQMLAQPYQADYVPLGFDSAFPTALNAFPVQDYTSGSIAGSPEGSIGLVGFSEGEQDTVLALAQDSAHVSSAGITSSAPASSQLVGLGSPTKAAADAMAHAPIC